LISAEKARLFSFEHLAAQQLFISLKLFSLWNRILLVIMKMLFIFGKYF